MDPGEAARWIAWKRASEAIDRAVVAAVSEATGLSRADFSVVTRVVEVEGGRLRQQRLADDLGWERSRLSRQLDRMAARGLVVREAEGAERWIAATAAGVDIVARARPVHANAVRQYLLNQMPKDQRAAFWAWVDQLAAAPAADQS